jgi:tetratricopeptide (TPR) repeat protein
MNGSAEKLYNEGFKTIKSGNTLEALAILEKAHALEPDNPRIQSALGLCIAYERGKIKEAMELCEKAIQSDPLNSYNYFHLGKVYSKADQKLKAIETYREGLRVDSTNPDIIAELQTLGLRAKPIITYLSRNNLLNKYIGIFFRRLGLK